MGQLSGTQQEGLAIKLYELDKAADTPSWDNLDDGSVKNLYLAKAREVIEWSKILKVKGLKQKLEEIPDDALVEYMYFKEDESISLVFNLGPTMFSIPKIPLYPGLPK